MGIFGRNIEKSYGAPMATPLAIASPWSPQDSLVTFAIDDALSGLLVDNGTITRDIALRVPGVKRAHGIACAMFARVSFNAMVDGEKAAVQPRWTYTSDTGISPYHCQLGMASDWFFYGWACLAFNNTMTDKIHVPYGLWKVLDDGSIWLDPEKINTQVWTRAIAIPLGYGENGLLNDGIDTLRQARKIEAAYLDRLDNPVPLTVLGIPQAIWKSWTPDERDSYLQQYVDARKKSGGSVALKIAEFPIDTPGAGETDLFETGRNAVRLDIANHTAMPAGLLEGLRQGGAGGGEIHYTSSAGGANRSELWDFGLPSRFVRAFEARLSLDDVLPGGQSLRADLTDEFASPNPDINTTRED